MISPALPAGGKASGVDAIDIVVDSAAGARHSGSALHAQSSMERRAAAATTGAAGAKTSGGDGGKEAEEKLPEQDIKVPLSDLLRWQRPELKVAIIGCIAAGALGCVTPAFSFLFAALTNVFYLPTAEEIRRESSFYSLMFFLVGIGGFIFATTMYWAFGEWWPLRRSPCCCFVVSFAQSWKLDGGSCCCLHNH